LAFENASPFAVKIFAVRYFPIHLNLKGRPVLVVGAGSVAVRKVREFLTAGAEVRVVAPRIHPRLKALSQRGRIDVRKRNYRTGDLRGVSVACAATDDPGLQRRIRGEADQRRVLLNVADQPELCDFILPARVRRGDFLLTVSTGGASPALARMIRLRLEKEFGPEYGRLVRRLCRMRQGIPRGERGAYRRGFYQILRDFGGRLATRER